MSTVVGASGSCTAPADGSVSARSAGVSAETRSAPKLLASMAVGSDRRRCTAKRHGSLSMFFRMASDATRNTGITRAQPASCSANAWHKTRHSSLIAARLAAEMSPKSKTRTWRSPRCSCSETNGRHASTEQKALDGIDACRPFASDSILASARSSSPIP